MRSTLIRTGLTVVPVAGTIAWMLMWPGHVSNAVLFPIGHWRAVVGLAVVTTANQPRRQAQLRGPAYLPARSHPARVATADPQSDHQTAKALGLTAAQLLLAQADEVIE
jgi:hypothetical protein